MKDKENGMDVNQCAHAWNEQADEYNQWDSLDADERCEWVIEAFRKDILVLVGRLYGEDPDTLAPETRKVMDQWVPEFQRMCLKENA